MIDENKLNKVLKLVLELLRESENKENKYHLVRAHNELMGVYLNENKNNQ